MDILRFVLKPDPDWRTDLRGIVPALEAEQEGFRPVEGEMERVGRNHGGQHRLVGGDGVARVDESLRHLAGNRRLDAGEADLELAGAKKRCCRGNVGIGGAKCRLALLDLLDARRLLRRKGS